MRYKIRTEDGRQLRGRPFYGMSGPGPGGPSDVGTTNDMSVDAAGYGPSGDISGVPGDMGGAGPEGDYIPDDSNIDPNTDPSNPWSQDLQNFRNELTEMNPNYLSNIGANTSELNLANQRNLDLLNEQQRGTRARSGQLGGLSDQAAGLSTIGGQIGALDPTKIATPDLATAQTQTGSIANTLQGIGQGGADPRFAAFRQTQLDQLGRDQQGQQARQSEFFNRRGMGGSSAALNAQNRLSTQFGNQSQALSSQLGMQSLGRQDQALMQALGARGQQGQLGIAGANLTAQQMGQRAGMLNNQAGLLAQQTGMQAGLIGQQQQFAGQTTGLGAGLLNQMSGNTQAKTNMANDAMTAYLENASIPAQLGIAQTAAENQGRDGGGGGGGGFFGLFG